MTNPLTIGVGILVVIGICVQLAVAWRYRCVRRGDDAEVFEKDVEWQLKHELSDAIAASQRSTPTIEGEMQEATTPLLRLPSSTDAMAPSPHIRFTDQTSTPGSWHDFKAYSRAEVDRMPTATATFSPPLSQNGFAEGHAALTYAEVNERDGGYGEHTLFVNPKQFHRILKRRMTRQLMEEYFRSRTDSHSDSIEHLTRERMRRPRGRDGRFLTLEEVGRMADGVVVA